MYFQRYGLVLMGTMALQAKNISLHVHELLKKLAETERSRSSFLGLYSIYSPVKDSGVSVSEQRQE